MLDPPARLGDGFLKRDYEGPRLAVVEFGRRVERAAIFRCALPH